MIPPTGIYAICVLTALNKLDIDVNDTVERVIVSITTFFMWLKFLYFLRIFRNTGYLIRMIVEVIKDMRNFFLVILITITAFGESFLRISMGNKNENERFTDGFIDSIIYAYSMVLGNIDTENIGEVA